MKKIILVSLFLAACTSRNSEPFVPEKVPSVDKVFTGKDSAGAAVYLNMFTEGDQWNVAGTKKRKQNSGYFVS